MAKPREKFKTYANVFDNFTVRNLFKLSTQGHFEEDTLQPVSIGKEGNVFAAERKDGSKVIVKIYRLETCDFNLMYQYLRVDPLYENLPRKRRQVIFAWAQREYRNLLKAREVIRVPTPFVCHFNILLMEMIGDMDPAQKLKDVELTDPEDMCNQVLDMLMAFYEKGYVHGDLSEFNILVHRDKAIFIDFSQATIRTANNAQELFERDVKNLKRFFGKHGVEVDDEELLERARKMRGRP